MKFGSRVAQFVEQDAAGFDRVGLDVDAAQGGRAQHAQRRQHDGAARADFEHVGATHFLGVCAQHLDQRRGVFARPERRHHRVRRQSQRVVHAASRPTSARQTPSSGNSASALR